jgi:hypothetical protein
MSACCGANWTGKLPQRNDRAGPPEAFSSVRCGHLLILCLTISIGPLPVADAPLPGRELSGVIQPAISTPKVHCRVEPGTFLAGVFS